ncbi:hypothetical protein EU527_13685 [Candidatus Thorarchaeota archaeon]|nr:MAG: hypothetical protein EU527_13685 [Candidatus Thorarchaeota archaeon]
MLEKDEVSCALPEYSIQLLLRRTKDISSFAFPVIPQINKLGCEFLYQVIGSEGEWIVRFSWVSEIVDTIPRVDGSNVETDDINSGIVIVTFKINIEMCPISLCCMISHLVVLSCVYLLYSHYFPKGMM